MATAATRTRIGPADHGRPMTLDEFRDADEVPGYRYELARGVLEVTEVPNDPHGLVVCNLLRAIGQYDRDHPQTIWRYGGAGEFRLWLPGMVSGRNPDMGLVLVGAPRDLRGRRRVALAAEVLSEGGEDRDYRVKKDEYFQSGLYEYWIVDPIARRVTMLVRDGDVWIEQAFEGETPLASVTLPGLELRPVDLWAGVDDEDEANPA